MAKMRVPQRISKKLQMLRDFFDEPSGNSALGALIRFYASQDGYFRQYVEGWIDKYDS